MGKLETVSYRSFFRVEEITILNDYLDTDTGKKDNNVSSYIKINIERFLSFLEEKQSMRTIFLLMKLQIV